MREIIFRAKSRSTGEWVYGHFYHSQMAIGGHPCEDVYFIRDECDEDHRVDEDTLGQSIGLSSKQGVQIYENDIVTMTRAGATTKGVVTFMDGAFYVLDTNSHTCIHFFSKISELKVVGDTSES